MNVTAYVEAVVGMMGDFPLAVIDNALDSNDADTLKLLRDMLDSFGYGALEQDDNTFLIYRLDSDEAKEVLAQLE